MKTFDVFLKDRLTQIDIIISTLTSREVFSFYNKMLIKGVLEELKFLKRIEISSDMEISTRLERLYSTVYAMAKTAMILDTDAEFSEEKFATGNSKMEIAIQPLYIVNKKLAEFSNIKYITAQVDFIDTLLSLGKADFNTTLSASRVETEKIGYIKPTIDFSLLGTADFSGKKVVELDSISMELNVEPLGLFYLTLAEGETSMYIGSAPIKDIVCSEFLHNVKLIADIKFEVLKPIVCEKTISIDSVIELLSSVDAILDKIIYPKISDIQLFCKASAEMYGYRLLKEMDSFMLSDFDKDTLKEVDYILIQ